MRLKKLDEYIEQIYELFSDKTMTKKEKGNSLRIILSSLDRVGYMRGLMAGRKEHENDGDNGCYRWDDR